MNVICHHHKIKRQQQGFCLKKSFLSICFLLNDASPQNIFVSVIVRWEIIQPEWMKTIHFMWFLTNYYNNCDSNHNILIIFFSHFKTHFETSIQAFDYINYDYIYIFYTYALEIVWLVAWSFEWIFMVPRGWTEKNLSPNFAVATFSFIIKSF